MEAAGQACVICADVVRALHFLHLASNRKARTEHGVGILHVSSTPSITSRDLCYVPDLTPVALMAWIPPEPWIPGDPPRAHWTA